MKKQTLLLFGILVATLSSCVYSLFPIYTEDTLVFREDLLGKWLINEGETEYLLFETLNNDASTTDKEEYKYTIEIQEGFTMRSNEPIFIKENGKKIYDVDSIKLIMNNRLASIEEEETEKPTLIESDIQAMEEDKYNSGDTDFKGSVMVHHDKSYRLTASNSEGEKEVYVAHLVEIGDHLFMDLYPVKEYDSKNISDNFFPVHTFYKVAISETEFTITHFDLDKLNKLFESNLIRLRHENVDGTILITAQPKELQKFFDTYADDESVFDSTETYRKAS